MTGGHGVTTPPLILVLAPWPPKSAGGWGLCPDTGHVFWWINKTAAGTAVIRRLRVASGGGEERVIGFSEAPVVLDDFPSFTVISHARAFHSLSKAAVCGAPARLYITKRTFT